MTLHPVEVDALAEHEATITSGLQTFKEVGYALADIRDRRLYRDDHGTFEDYCRERWNLTPQHAGRLISAADVAAQMEPIGSIATESQARAIKPILRDHGPEVAAEVLAEAEASGRITARSITEAAERVIEPEVITADEWMAREGYAQPDELAARRTTDAERERFRAEDKAKAIRQRNLDVNVAFTAIDELTNPDILAEVQAHWQPLAQHWTASRLHQLADTLHAIADQWKVTA